jgi:hypothetical protein
VDKQRLFLAEKRRFYAIFAKSGREPVELWINSVDKAGRPSSA